MYNNYNNSISMIDEILLQLLRKSLFDIDYSDYLLAMNLKALWDSIYNEAKIHNIEPLTFQGIISLPQNIQPEEELMLKWRNYVIIRVLLNEQLMNEQSTILDILDSSGIKPIILKGSSVCCFYPKPELRPLGDIDILIKKEECEAASNILINNGFTFHSEHDFHRIFKKNDVTIELHLSVTSFPENKVGEKLFKELESVFDDACQCRINRAQFLSPSPFHNAIILLLHMQRHLSKGIGLRQLCDWIMFVNSNSQPELWEKLLNFLKETGLKTFAATITKIGILYLGLDPEKCVWCLDADNSVCQLLLTEILNSGNMGNKRNSEDSASGFLIGGIEKSDGNNYGIVDQMRVILRNLNDSAKREFPLFRKISMLLPVMWIYIPIRYFVRMLLGKRPELSTRKLIKSFDEKKDLYMELKIFQTKGNK